MPTCTAKRAIGREHRESERRDRGSRPLGRGGRPLGWPAQSSASPASFKQPVILDVAWPLGRHVACRPWPLGRPALLRPCQSSLTDEAKEGGEEGVRGATESIARARATWGKACPCVCVRANSVERSSCQRDRHPSQMRQASESDERQASESDERAR